MGDAVNRAIERIEKAVAATDEEVGDEEGYEDDDDPEAAYTEGYAEGLRAALSMLKEVAEGVR